MPVVDNPTMAANISNSAATTALAPVSSNPEATLPTALANLKNQGSLKLLANSIEMAKKKTLEEIKT